MNKDLMLLMILQNIEDKKMIPWKKYIYKTNWKTVENVRI